MSEGKPEFGEQIYVAGHELVETVKKLIAEGNARSLILWSEAGKKLLEIPLTGGVVIGGAAVVMAPFLAALAAIAGVVGKVRIEVVPRAGKDRGEAEPPEGTGL